MTADKSQMSLKELVLFPYEFTQRKHELDEDYVEDTLNNMTRMEFLTAISDALDEWATQHLPVKE